MAKWAFGCLGRVLFLGVLFVGCSAPEDRKEPVTEKKSALVNNVFTPYVTYPTGSRAEAVAVGDLDGDGRIDAAIVTGTSSDLANDHMLDVFLQASDGTFRPMVQYLLSAPSPRSLDIGDVNGDGRADVVVGNPNGAASSVDVLLQNASGTLDAAVSYAAANADQVKIGDFNGDGRMDVAGLIAGSSGDGLDVLLQTATGTLAAPVTYHVAHGLAGDLDAGDVNGDGRTDLVVSPGLSVLLQNTDGTMAAPVTYAAGGGATLAGSAVGDSNGDGRADVLVSYNGTSPNAFIARLLQNGQGTLAPAVTYGTAANPGPMVVADIDPDGRKDILVLHKYSGQPRRVPAGALGRGWSSLTIPSGYHALRAALLRSRARLTMGLKLSRSVTSTMTDSPTRSSRTTTTGWSCSGTPPTRRRRSRSRRRRRAFTRWASQST